MSALVRQSARLLGAAKKSRRSIQLGGGSSCRSAAGRSLSSSSTPDVSYEKPATVREWETKAAQELKRSKTGRTVDQMRTERRTPEGIELQPVYYDLSTSTDKRRRPRHARRLSLPPRSLRHHVHLATVDGAAVRRFQHRPRIQRLLQTKSTSGSAGPLRGL